MALKVNSGGGKGFAKTGKAKQITTGGKPRKSAGKTTTAGNRPKQSKTSNPKTQRGFQPDF